MKALITAALLLTPHAVSAEALVFLVYEVTRNGRIMTRDLQGPPMAVSLCKAMAPLVAADAISKTKRQSPYGQFTMLGPTSTRIEIGKESAIARWYCSAS